MSYTQKNSLHKNNKLDKKPVHKTIKEKRAEKIAKKEPNLYFDDAEDLMAGHHKKDGAHYRDYDARERGKFEDEYF